MNLPTPQLKAAVKNGSDGRSHYNLTKSFNGRKFSRRDESAYTEWLGRVIRQLLPTLKQTATVAIAAHVRPVFARVATRGRGPRRCVPRRPGRRDVGTEATSGPSSGGAGQPVGVGTLDAIGHRAVGVLGRVLNAV